MQNQVDSSPPIVTNYKVANYEILGLVEAGRYRITEYHGMHGTLKLAEPIPPEPPGPIYEYRPELDSWTVLQY